MYDKQYNQYPAGLASQISLTLIEKEERTISKLNILESGPNGKNPSELTISFGEKNYILDSKEFVITILEFLKNITTREIMMADKYTQKVWDLK